MIRKIALVAAVSALGALTMSCTKSQTELDPGVKFDTSVPFVEVMGQVVDPAAWGFWNYTGEVDTPEGVVQKAPPDPSSIPDDPNSLEDDAQREALEQKWIDIENGTYQLIEAGNIMQLPGYVRKVETNDNGDWIKFAQALQAKAHEAQEAVRAKDRDKMFTTGGEIFDICTECHQKYLQPFIDPNTGHIPHGLDENGAPIEAREGSLAR